MEAGVSCWPDDYVPTTTNPTINTIEIAMMIVARFSGISVSANNHTPDLQRRRSDGPEESHIADHFSIA
jgi:hypothetical protein